jgi:AraC-like DNA-binding protein
MIRFIREGFREFDRQRRVGPVQWPHHDHFFVHRGGMRLEFPDLGRAVDLGRGEGVLIWPLTRFHGGVRGKAARASIHHVEVNAGIGPPFSGMLHQRGGFSRQTAGPSPWLQECVEHLHALSQSREATPDLDLRRQQLLGVILGEGGYLSPDDFPATRPRFDLARLAAWLRDNLAHRQGIPGLAAQSGLSPSRFRAVFLAEHGITAGEFIMAVREQEACRRLAETAVPLKALASELGYADVAVFHRAFKSRTGQTPATYRRLHRIHG